MMRTFRRRSSRIRRHPLPPRDSEASLPGPAPGPQQAPARAWPVWRMEYALLGAIGALITALAFVFFYFDLDVADLNRYGYIGLFAISLISAASIVLPMPGAAAIAGAGALLDPVLGVPVPIVVALVASPAEAIGELTAYAAGYGGRPLFQDRPFYPRIRAWMERRGVMTMFLLSAFPNPFVDVAGVTAGAVRMPVWHFFSGVVPGKIIKNLYLSAGGLAGAELARRLLG